MKSIILSERPKHACNILNRIKHIDIRRNAPQNWIKFLTGKTDKKPEPITVYVYCSLTPNHNLVINDLFVDNRYWVVKDNKDKRLNGKILAKFTLRRVEAIHLIDETRLETATLKEDNILEQSCLCRSEIYPYLNFDKEPCGYAWFIEDLVIFDQPKNLSEFKRTTFYSNCNVCPFSGNETLCEEHRNCTALVPIIKAPQSWGYCDE